jgi:hypothetical protein
VSPRRAGKRSTITSTRTTANELPFFPKTLELEHRVAKLEARLNDLLAGSDALNKRLVAIQAQLDHLVARISQLR